MNQLKNTTRQSGKIDPVKVEEQTRKIAGDTKGQKMVYPTRKINVYLEEPHHKKLKMLGVMQDFNMQDKVTELIVKWLNTQDL